MSTVNSSSTAGRKLRIATRGSQLALWQAHRIGELLGEDIEIVVVKTIGDATQATNTPIEAIRGQGVFVKEVQAAVLDGRADIASHSAKDLPARTADGLSLAGIPLRGDPRDALIGKSLSELPAGALIGTGSVRRRAQLASLRPDLTFRNIRGNVDSRLKKAGEYDAIVLAYAPLQRLERTDVHPHVLDPSVMLPQVGQGALAAECRSDDEYVLERLTAITDEPSMRAVVAEREFLATLGGGCDLPVGAYAIITDSNQVSMKVMLASLDGRVVLRREGVSDNGIELGRDLANQLLHKDGGQELLLNWRSSGS